jgi:hypothetical protein
VYRRLVAKLKDGREVELADGATYEDLDEMLADGDLVDEDQRHYLDIGRDDVAEVIELS